MMRSVAPLRPQSICQGTMLLWCSISDIRISSPSPTNFSPKENARVLIEPVAPLVKMISLVEEAFRNRRVVSRAAS